MQRTAADDAPPPMPTHLLLFQHARAPHRRRAARTLPAATAVLPGASTAHFGSTVSLAVLGAVGHAHKTLPFLPAFPSTMASSANAGGAAAVAGGADTAAAAAGAADATGGGGGVSVGNLRYGLTEEDVMVLFGRYGHVTRLQLGRGACALWYADAADAEHVARVLHGACPRRPEWRSNCFFYALSRV
jgi:hypothetical protein